MNPILGLSLDELSKDHENPDNTKAPIPRFWIPEKEQTPVNDRVIKAHEFLNLNLSGLKVLDGGTGETAIFVKEIAGRVGSKGEIVGIELIDSLREEGMKVLQRTGIENAVIVKGDLRSIPYPQEYFDLVSLYCTVHSLEDFEKPGHTPQVFAEAYRVLKPQGDILIVDDAEPPEDCPEQQRLAWEYILWEIEYAALAHDTHELYYSPQEIVQLLTESRFRQADWVWIDHGKRDRIESRVRWIPWILDFYRDKVSDEIHKRYRKWGDRIACRMKEQGYVIDLPVFAVKGRK